MRIAQTLYAAAIAAIIVIPSCGRVPSVPLTDDLVRKYIAAYPKLRAQGPAIADTKGNVNIKEGGTGFNTVDKIVREAGFRDFTEFMKVQTTIAAAMSIVECDLYVEKMMKAADAMGNTGALEGQFSGLLNNPDIPESTKAEVRKQIAASGDLAVKEKEKFQKEYEKGKPMLNKAREIADPNSVAIVKRYHGELREAMGAQREE